jgi:hypothetical protein
MTIAVCPQLQTIVANYQARRIKNMQPSQNTKGIVDLDGITDTLVRRIHEDLITQSGAYRNRFSSLLPETG